MKTHGLLHNKVWLIKYSHGSNILNYKGQKLSMRRIIRHYNQMNNKLKQSLAELVFNTQIVCLKKVANNTDSYTRFTLINLIKFSKSNLIRCRQDQAAETT